MAVESESRKKGEERNYEDDDAASMFSLLLTEHRFEPQVPPRDISAHVGPEQKQANENVRKVEEKKRRDIFRVE